MTAAKVIYSRRANQNVSCLGSVDDWPAFGPWSQRRSFVTLPPKPRPPILDVVFAEAAV